MKTMYFVISTIIVTWVATFTTTINSAARTMYIDGVVIPQPLQDIEVTDEVYELIAEMSVGCNIASELETALLNDGKILESEAIHLVEICEAQFNATTPTNPFERGMNDQRRVIKNTGGIKM